MEEKRNRPKRTPFDEIGKINAVDQLFENSGYTNNDPIKFNRTAGSESVSVSRILLEGIDFDLTYHPLKHLGYKAALLALGPVYAAGYIPEGLFFNIGLSARFCYEDLQDLWNGVLAACKEHGIKYLGLDPTSSINGLCLAVSASGSQSRKILKAFPKPEKNGLICLTGNVGAAYMGLHVLEREKIAFNKIPAGEAGRYKQPDLSKYKYLLSQYLSPEINPKMLAQFKEVDLYPAAGYFITRGLSYSVRQLCRETGLGARIFLDKIPIASQTFEMAEELNMDAITAALNGGDDYKFLFVIPLDKHETFHREFPNVDIIGHLCPPEAGASLVTPEGAVLELKAQGW